ncbi:MAG: ABC transporter permease [Chitinophagales bacterium]
MKRFTNTNNFFPTGLILGFLAVWEGIVRWQAIPNYILPGPFEVAVSFYKNFPIIVSHSAVTILECIMGFILAVLLAFIIAILMDEIKPFKEAVYPLLIASQTVPIIFIAPLFIIWFGYGIMPKIIVVVLVCFFPIAINFLSGLAGIDQDYINLFRSMRASRLQTLRLVKIPLAMPTFFSGLKISATYSVMGAVIGEWLGAERGLGLYMTLSQHSFQVDRVFAAILAITILSLILFGMISALEKLIIPWWAETARDI